MGRHSGPRGGGGNRRRGSGSRGPPVSRPIAAQPVGGIGPSSEYSNQPSSSSSNPQFAYDHQPLDSNYNMDASASGSERVELNGEGNRLAGQKRKKKDPYQRNQRERTSIAASNPDESISIQSRMDPEREWEWEREREKEREREREREPEAAAAYDSRRQRDSNSFSFPPSRQETLSVIPSNHESVHNHTILGSSSAPRPESAALGLSIMGRANASAPQLESPSQPHQSTYHQQQHQPTPPSQRDERNGRDPRDDRERPTEPEPEQSLLSTISILEARAEARSRWRLPPRNLQVRGGVALRGRAPIPVDPANVNGIAIGGSASTNSGNGIEMRKWGKEVEREREQEVASGSGNASVGTNRGERRISETSRPLEVDRQRDHARYSDAVSKSSSPKFDSNVNSIPIPSPTPISTPNLYPNRKPVSRPAPPHPGVNSNGKERPRNADLERSIAMVRSRDETRRAESESNGYFNSSSNHSAAPSPSNSTPLRLSQRIETVRDDSLHRPQASRTNSRDVERARFLERDRAVERERILERERAVEREKAMERERERVAARERDEERERAADREKALERERELERELERENRGKAWGRSRDLPLLPPQSSSRSPIPPPQASSRSSSRDNEREREREIRTERENRDKAWGRSKDPLSHSSSSSPGDRERRIDREGEQESRIERDNRDRGWGRSRDPLPALPPPQPITSRSSSRDREKERESRLEKENRDHAWSSRSRNVQEPEILSSSSRYPEGERERDFVRGGMREEVRDRGGLRDQERERDRERDVALEREREREREWEIEREREREIREKGKERERERDRDRERGRERERSPRRGGESSSSYRDRNARDERRDDRRDDRIEDRRDDRLEDRRDDRLEDRRDDRLDDRKGGRRAGRKDARALYLGGDSYRPGEERSTDAYRPREDQNIDSYRPRASQAGDSYRPGEERSPNGTHRSQNLDPDPQPENVNGFIPTKTKRKRAGRREKMKVEREKIKVEKRRESGIREAATGDRGGTRNEREERNGPRRVQAEPENDYGNSNASVDEMPFGGRDLEDRFERDSRDVGDYAGDVDIDVNLDPGPEEEDREGRIRSRTTTVNTSDLNSHLKEFPSEAREQEFRNQDGDEAYGASNDQHALEDSKGKEKLQIEIGKEFPAQSPFSDFDPEASSPLSELSEE